MTCFSTRTRCFGNARNAIPYWASRVQRTGIRSTKQHQGGQAGCAVSGTDGALCAIGAIPTADQTLAIHDVTSRTGSAVSIGAARTAVLSTGHALARQHSMASSAGSALEVSRAGRAGRRALPTRNKGHQQAGKEGNEQLGHILNIIQTHHVYMLH